MHDIPLPGYDPNSPPTGCTEIVVHPTLGRDSAEFRQIVKFVESLGAGQKPKQAATTAGTTLKALKLQGREVQKYLAKARAEYTATADDLRELTQLQWVQRALKDPSSPGYDARESMAALHEISLIPEVGLKARPGAVGAVGPRVFSEDTQTILDAVDVAEGGTE